MIVYILFSLYFAELNGLQTGWLIPAAWGVVAAYAIGRLANIVMEAR